MKKRRMCLIAALFLISFIFGGNVSYSDDQSKQEELYKKALSLKDEGDYNGAHEILKKLISESPNISKYEISYVDTVLDQSLELKNSNNSEWKTKAKEAGSKIKMLYRTNLNNADYYLIWAKYSWIIESRKESNVSKALEKAFYFKPNYSYAYIVKGDIYYGLARSSNSSGHEPQPGTAAALAWNPEDSKRSLAETAKSAYEAAISSPDIDNNKKAYVHYKLGELENQIFSNKENAKKNWEKTVALTPDTKFGKLAKEHLGK